MAAQTNQENLQPSLLDRLTDDEPEKKEESRYQRVLSPSQLRDSVRRDLAWLFNTTNLASIQPEVERYPSVVRSTLNYGLPDLAGRTVKSIDALALERLLRNAIIDFEPRLLRDSVRVTLDVSADDMSHNAMTFSIEATLWAQPIPLRLFFRTAIDLDVGKVEIAEWTEGLA